MWGLVSKLFLWTFSEQSQIQAAFFPYPNLWIRTMCKQMGMEGCVLTAEGQTETAEEQTEFVEERTDQAAQTVSGTVRSVM